MEQFDYIVVGAGSAGCILAERLTRDGRFTVLLLEAGTSDGNLWTRVPLGYGKTFFDKRVNWRYHSVAEPGLGGRRMYWPRGKGLGGSSAINGLVWMRGLPFDFNDWANAGNPGWGWNDVAPIFDSIEDQGSGRTHSNGRISVADRSDAYHPIGQRYLDAAEETGLQLADKAHSHWQEGVAPYRLTTRQGMRDSSADAFLKPARGRKTLRVRKNCIVEKLTFEGKRVAAVHFRCNGVEMTAQARADVVLAAGAVGSPGILQRSGIGPSALLKNLGISSIYANDAVGGGLQDHLAVDYLFRATEPTLNQTIGRLWGQVQSVVQFLLWRSGPLTLSVNQMGGLVRSHAAVPRPDIQLYFTPLSYSTTWRNKRPLMRPDPWPGFAFGFNTCRPTSRGRIDIANNEAITEPRITPRYLSTNEDVENAVAGARLIERMLKTRAMRGLIDAATSFSPSGARDADILSDFRMRSSTVFHPCGTCRMAPEQDAGVVDASLRVYGVEGLRVADASIFPNITSANTNAPTMMVAAKAADMILKA